MSIEGSIDYNKLKKADSLFKDQLITSQDVFMLTVIDIFDAYEKANGSRITWEKYLDIALARKKASLQNINNVKQKGQ